jgi:hypothetical protein
MAAAKTTTNFRQGTLHDPKQKKHVTRFDNYQKDPPPLLSNAYVTNTDLDAIGQPGEITVVVLPGKVKVKSVTLV